jgi:hypothetical protein
MSGAVFASGWWAPALGWCLNGYSAVARIRMGQTSRSFRRGPKSLGFRPRDRGSGAGINAKRSPGRSRRISFSSVCARGDLNPHARRHRNLNPACLPISPLALGPATRFSPSITGLMNVRRRMPVFIVASRRRGLRQRRSGQASSFRSRRSLATCPVARTLYWASATLPSGSTTMVERIRPW